MIDVTENCEDRSSEPMGGKNPEIWWEGMRIGFRCPDTIVIDHPMFFVNNHPTYGPRICKYQADEFFKLMEKMRVPQ